jgi:hypothetical protein
VKAFNHLRGRLMTRQNCSKTGQITDDLIAMRKLSYGAQKLFQKWSDHRWRDPDPKTCL